MAEANHYSGTVPVATEPLLQADGLSEHSYPKGWNKFIGKAHSAAQSPDEVTFCKAMNTASAVVNSGQSHLSAPQSP